MNYKVSFLIYLFLLSFCTVKGQDHPDSLKVYTTTRDEAFHFYFENSLPDSMEVKIFNRWGKNIASRSQWYEAGKHFVDVAIPNQQEGVYVYSIAFMKGKTYRGSLINILTSVFSSSGAATVNVYPNPFNHFILIKGGKDFLVNVYNNSTCLIHQQKGIEEINTSLWTQGIYFLEIVDKGNKHIYPMIKQ